MAKPSTRIERLYRAAIDKLLDEYFKVPSSGTLGDIVAALSDWRKLPDFINSRANHLARQMVTMAAIQDEKTWRQAATKASSGADIYRMLRTELQGASGARVNDLVRDNAQLIKSVPTNVAETLTARIQRYQIQGMRPDQIAKSIGTDLPNLKAYQVQRIARTETSKAVTVLTQARSEQMGLNWYQWTTSEDGRVRASHRLMDKVLIQWSDPPDPERLAREKYTYGRYQAGATFNCRCIALPVVTADELSFPVKVHLSGQLKSLNKKQFLAIAGADTKRLA